MSNCHACGIQMPSDQQRYRHCDECRPAYQAAMKRALQVVDRMRKLGLADKATNHRCADCEAKASVWDHRDYSQPAVIEPLCRRCNWMRPPAKFVGQPGRAA